MGGDSINSIRNKFSPYSLPAVTYLAVLWAAANFGSAVVAIMLTGVLAALLVLAFKYRRAWPIFAACAVFAGIAVLTNHLYDNKTAPLIKLEGSSCHVEARVAELTDSFESGSFRVPMKIISVNGQKCGGGVAVYFDFDPALQIGDTAVFDAKLKIAKKQSRFNETSGYPVTCSVYGKDKLAIEKPQLRNAYFYAAAARSFASGCFERYLPQQAAALAKGIVLGDKSGLDAEINRIFRYSGMLHALTVSGMHISILVFFLGFVLKPLRVGRKLSLVVISISVIAFIAMVGFSPSALRSGMMAIIFYLGIAFFQPSSAVNSLLLTTVAITLFAPYSINNISLQLSVAACLGMLLFYDAFGLHFNNFLCKLRLKGFVVKLISEPFAASCSAMVLLAPLLAVYFGEIQIFAPISMLLTSFAVSVIFFLSLVMLAVSFISPAAGFLAVVISLACKYLVAVIRYIADIPFASLSVSNVFYWIAVPALIIIFAAAYKFKRQGATPVYATAFSICIIAASIFTYKPFYTLFMPGRYCLFSVLDVGQGACTVIQDGSSVVLVDAGSTSGAVAADTIEKQLRKNGVRKINALILTHCHEDHASAVKALAARYKVECIYLPYACRAETAACDIMQAAQGSGTKVLLIDKDTSIMPIDDIAVRIIADQINMAENKSDKNESCLAVRAEFKGSSILIAGDMTHSGELDVLRLNEDIDSDVLVVAHHGAKTSSSELFLSKVTPQTAVISVGPNIFGHPSVQTEQRLRAFTDNLYRTDKDGCVSFLADEKSLLKLGF